MRCLLAAWLAVTGVSAGTLSVGLSKTQHDSRSSLAKRGTLDLDAVNNITGGGYYSTFEVGTPPQKLQFLLDTGSSDTWVNSKTGDLCNSISDQTLYGFCTATFDSSASSTFKVVDKDGFNITYLDGRQISGSYFNDTVTIGGKQIKNQQLGLAEESVRPAGIMGLGFTANVAASKQYPTILDHMRSQGLIDREAFSLYLNELTDDSGTILFGGFDPSRYVGRLATLPLTSDFQAKGNQVTSFAVKMEGFAINGSDNKTVMDIGNFNATAILDSGSTVCLLPKKYVTKIWTEYDVRTVEGVPEPFIDCKYAKKKGNGISFEFRFANKTIIIPMHAMVVDAFTGLQNDLKALPGFSSLFNDWHSVCMFGISSATTYGVKSDQFALLGDTFLRSAYVVYDLANKQIGLAEAGVTSGKTKADIIELKATSKDIPDVNGTAVKAASDDNAARHLVPGIVAALLPAIGVLMML